MASTIQSLSASLILRWMRQPTFSLVFFCFGAFFWKKNTSLSKSPLGKRTGYGTNFKVPQVQEKLSNELSKLPLSPLGRRNLCSFKLLWSCVRAMPLVPMHAVWPWHWRGGAGRGGSCFRPLFFKKKYEQNIQQLHSFFFSQSTGFKP